MECGFAFSEFSHLHPFALGLLSLCDTGFQLSDISATLFDFSIVLIVSGRSAISGAAAARIAFGVRVFATIARRGAIVGSCSGSIGSLLFLRCGCATRGGWR